MRHTYNLAVTVETDDVTREFVIDALRRHLLQFGSRLFARQYIEVTSVSLARPPKPRARR
jgi:hypothetical protein